MISFLIKKKVPAMLMLSIIIPFYNEEEQVELTVSTVTDIVSAIPELDYELVLVNDGSTDQTWARMEACAARDSHLHILSFSRNFGKEAAISAGLDACLGDAAVLMDGDLQHPPEYIPEMVRLWREDGYDVVDGVKKARQNESRFGRWAANSFYSVFRRVSGIDLRNASDFKLLDRQVIDAWNSLEERETFFRALSAWLGYRRVRMPFQVADRTTGTTKWNWRSLWSLSVNAFTGFSSAALQLISSMGIVFLIVALVLGIQTLVNWATGRSLGGFTTVILLILIAGGAIMVALGLIGTYIGKIYTEVKGRPRYLIARENRRPVTRAGQKAERERRAADTQADTQPNDSDSPGSTV